MRYVTVYADPPWYERGAGKIKRGADRHYPLMKTADIAALPVADLAADNAHLYLWATNNFMPDALRVMDAWGFRYITMITWAKEGGPGLGQYFRGKSEHLLFGVRGRLKVLEQGTTLMYAPRGRHSEKPDVFRQLVERCSPAPRIELFARSAYQGWDVWGNEVTSNTTLLDTQEER